MDNLLDTFEGKQRSVIAAYVLWFFLGRFGAHRFYLGYKRSALIMLALSVAGLIATTIAAWGSAKVSGADFNSALQTVLLAPNTLLGWIGDLILGGMTIWWLLDGAYTYVMVRRRNNQGLIPASLIEPSKP
ncbi:TM2 domain-containing protein [Polymorphobacter arshaanensis]|uniref:TM2 domain-containing protein n=1 Tax=Glacieibacterium arshaanense TaxID=2511025 RepID=A0A4Y9EQ80_9SPHN|nr:TM2 domain-containing protein [Polymorphobacter arshaanensis]TFU03804.1 TM2 domain-containing protein [Polymorphobacter arshaanensis]